MTRRPVCGPSRRDHHDELLAVEEPQRQVKCRQHRAETREITVRERAPRAQRHGPDRPLPVQEVCERHRRVGVPEDPWQPQLAALHLRQPEVSKLARRDDAQVRWRHPRPVRYGQRDRHQALLGRPPPRAGRDERVERDGPEPQAVDWQRRLEPRPEPPDERCSRRWSCEQEGQDLIHAPMYPPRRDSCILEVRHSVARRPASHPSISAPCAAPSP